MKTYDSLRCPRCLEKKITIATAKHENDNKYSWGKCISCGWYGKLKSCLKDIK